MVLDLLSNDYSEGDLLSYFKEKKETGELFEPHMHYWHDFLGTLYNQSISEEFLSKLEDVVEYDVKGDLDCSAQLGQNFRYPPSRDAIMSMLTKYFEHNNEGLYFYSRIQDIGTFYKDLERKKNYVLLISRKYLIDSKESEDFSNLSKYFMPFSSILSIDPTLYSEFCIHVLVWGVRSLQRVEKGDNFLWRKI